tara:strand:+ start:9303 stop:9584 length:282 start_codon:yes stop_codon:yes gene_type:complete
MQIGLMPSEVKNWIRHQLARQMMGDLATAIDPEERQRWLRWIEVQMLDARASAQGVTSRVLQQPNRLWSGRILEETLLPQTLLFPSVVKGHGS